MPQNNGRFDKLEVDNMDLIEFSGENRSLHLLPAKKAWWLKLFRKGLLSGSPGEQEAGKANDRCKGGMTRCKNPGSDDGLVGREVSCLEKS